MRFAWLAVLAACSTTTAPPVVKFGNGGGLDAVMATAFDGDGNIYVTGRSQNTVTIGDITVPGHGFSDAIAFSLTPDGTVRWALGWGNHSGDEGHGIAVDANGHVFVSGYFMDEVQVGDFDLVDAGTGDIFLVELDAATGRVLDARRYGTPGADDTGRLAVDDKGEPILCGVFGAGELDLGGPPVLRDSHDSNAFVAALDANLHPRWVRTLADAGLDACNGIALDVDGNVTVTGGFGGTADFGSGLAMSLATSDSLGVNGYMASYSASGEPRFSHAFASRDGSIASSVAIAPNHRLYVGGVWGSSGFVAAFDEAGTPLYQTTLDASVGDIAGFYDGVWLAGALATDPGHSDALVEMVTSDGSEHSAQRIGGASYDSASAISLTYDGHVVAGGQWGGQGFVTILPP